MALFRMDFPVTQNPSFPISPPAVRAGRFLIQPGQRDPRENYDSSIDEKTGDVTIKLTHYENSCFAYYLDDKGSIIDFDKGSNNSASMATTRRDVTMVIKNKSDDVLGDKIPDFNITEIKQEVV